MEGDKTHYPARFVEEWVCPVSETAKVTSAI